MIIKNYLTGWFALDIVATFPYDSLSSIFGGTKLQILRLLKFIRIFRLIKIVNTMKGNKFTKLMLKNKYGREINLRMSENILFYELFKMLTILFLICHYSTIIWLSIYYTNKDNPDIYINKYNLKNM